MILDDQFIWEIHVFLISKFESLNSLDKTHLNDHNSFSFCLLVCWSLVIFCFVFIPSYLLFLKALKQSHPITLIIIVSPSFHLLILWSLIIFFFCFIFFLFSLDDQWNESWRKFICDANLELESQRQQTQLGYSFGLTSLYFFEIFVEPEFNL